MNNVSRNTFDEQWWAVPYNNCIPKGEKSSMIFLTQKCLQIVLLNNKLQFQRNRYLSLNNNRLSRKRLCKTNYKEKPTDHGHYHLYEPHDR